MVSIISLLKNKGDSHYAIHCIVNADFFRNLDAQKQMTEIVAGIDAESSIEFVDFDEKNASIPYNKNMAFGGGICYYKMDSYRLLPNIDRVIHLDDDTIILKPLDELADIDLGDNYMAAFAVGNAFHLSARRSAYKDICEFNAGVVALNLKLIRESKVYESFAEILKNKDLSYEQGLMSVAFKGKLAMCNDGDTTYNFRIHCDRARGKEIGIIHYTGKKPWFFPTRMSGIWWKYAKMSPFYKTFLANAIYNFFLYIFVMPIPSKSLRHKLRSKFSRV